MAKIKVGNKFLTGREFQACFSLNSSAFSISHEKKNMVIITRGFGDGLGLSLYGAEAMGDANADYGEILQHYFVGTSLEQISAFYHVTETKE